MSTFMDWLTPISIVAGMCGFGGIVAHAVNRKFDEDRRERREIEQANREETVTQRRGLTTIGHLARATACAQLASNGPNADVSTAIGHYDKWREDDDEQTRQRVAERLHGSTT